MIRTTTFATAALAMAGGAVAERVEIVCEFEQSERSLGYGLQGELSFDDDSHTGVIYAGHGEGASPICEAGRTEVRSEGIRDCWVMYNRIVIQTGDTIAGERVYSWTEINRETGLFEHTVNGSGNRLISQIEGRCWPNERKF